MPEPTDAGESMTSAEPTGTLNTGLKEMGPFFLHPSNLGNPQIFVHGTAPIGEGLLQEYKGNDVRGLLAESCEISDDFLTWTFKLNKGVQFHKGYGEMTAEDVVWSMRQWGLSKHPRAGQLETFWAPREGSEIIDDYTVQVHTGEPLVHVIAQRWHMTPGGASTFIASKKQTEELGVDEASTQIAATGPWEIVDHRTGEFWKMAAVRDHWRHTPEFAEFVMWEIPEESSRLAGFQTGQLDTFLNGTPLRGVLEARMTTVVPTVGGNRETNPDAEVILEAQDLKKYFPVTKGLLVSKVTGWIKAVDGISFQIRAGETLGVVGESGCGKSTTAKMLLMLEEPTEGIIRFQGRDVHNATHAERRQYRSSVQAVFQDPWSSLNPRMRVRDVIAEPMIINLNMSRRDVQDRVAKLLNDVGLSSYHANLYPHEFSGGQRQRLAIARALSVEPKLIVLDEPVSALDVSIRAQIMNLLKDLQHEYQVSYMLIAHDLATVRYMCDWVAVMYLGQIVEFAPKTQLFNNASHPYTKALMSAALPSHPDIQKEEMILTGEVPSPLNPPEGCRFHPRCPVVMERCSHEVPKLREMSPGHAVYCHLY